MKNRTTKRKTTEQFIAEAMAIHEGMYDYSLSNYKNCFTKVVITCPHHGDFEQRPSDHLVGKGCAKCAGKNKSTEDIVRDFKRTHGDKYDYSKVEYVNSRTKVIIICSEHGEFFQNIHHHLKGSGCPRCAGEERGIQTVLRAGNKRNWNFKQPEDYKLIPLTQGRYAKVDNEDFERLKEINWQVTKQGYVSSGTVGLMHRYIMNAPDHLEVDHENHDTLDNRKSNLRLATRPENSANTKPRKGSSIYKGVSWNNHINKWVGQIYVEGEHHRLGYFKDEIECAKAYDRKALELQGEFAYLNFPDFKQEYLKELNK